MSSQMSLGPFNQAKWISTNVLVNQGDKVTIAASGTIKIQGQSSLSLGPDGYVDANGTPQNVPTPDPNFVDNQLPLHTLIGIISDSQPRVPVTAGTAFRVGSSVTHTVTASGQLYMIINENTGMFHDNSGSFTVTIDVESATTNKPIYEYKAETGTVRFRYSSNPNLADSNWTKGNVVFFASADLGDGMVPVYEHPAGSGVSLRYLYTTEPSGGNGWGEGTVAFYAYSNAKPGTVAINQFYEVFSSGWKFRYSTLNDVGSSWTSQGPAFYAVKP